MLETYEVQVVPTAEDNPSLKESQIVELQGYISGIQKQLKNVSDRDEQVRLEGLIARYQGQISQLSQ